MDILVLGGTRFFGIHLVNKLIQDGHNVTVATRGLTKDNFGSSVKRILIDRNSRESIRGNLSRLNFDVVVDNICYCPNNTKNLLELINTKRYVFTSSTAVYSPGLNMTEEKYNPFKYEIKYGDRPEFSYDEGKRLSEAVAFQCYEIPTVAVRFPIVLGEDDFTKRLFFYVDRIKRGIPINVTNFDSQISFIDSKQAGEFLAFMAENDFTGPINACSDGMLTIRKIIRLIEKIVGCNAIISENGEEATYNSYENCTVNSSKAKSLGFNFNKITDYFYDLASWLSKKE